MTVGSQKYYTGHTAVGRAFRKSQWPNLTNIKFSPPPAVRRGTPRCRFQIGEGPALQSSQQVMLAMRNSASASAPLGRASPLPVPFPRRPNPTAVTSSLRPSKTRGTPPWSCISRRPLLWQGDGPVTYLPWRAESTVVAGIACAAEGIESLLSLHPANSSVVRNEANRGRSIRSASANLTAVL
jgi:hypothetical protein